MGIKVSSSGVQRIFCCQPRHYLTNSISCTQEEGREMKQTQILSCDWSQSHDPAVATRSCILQVSKSARKLVFGAARTVVNQDDSDTAGYSAVRCCAQCSFLAKAKFHHNAYGRCECFSCKMQAFKYRVRK